MYDRKETDHKYYLAHKERHKQLSEEWRKQNQNSKRYKKVKRIWRQKNKDKILLKRKAKRAENPELYHRLDRDRVQKYRQKIKRYIVNYKKSHPCIKCNENDIACLEFHHNNSNEKLFDVSQFGRGGRKLDIIKKEMQKCQILCANCHAKFHYYNTGE